MRLIGLRSLGLILFIFGAVSTYAQIERKSISFQGILKQDDNLLIDQQVYFKLEIFNDTTQISLYEEEQNTLTNEFALFNIYLGEGTSTGNGQNENYNEVVWSDPIWLKIEYRLNEIDDFVWMGTRKFQSMAYAMYADSSSGENVGINDLFDIQNNQQDGYLLKWDGENWMSSTDAIYAWNTINSDSSIYSDTVMYAWSLLDPVPTDTVGFSIILDSSQYSQYSDSALFSTLSLYTDTVGFAFDVVDVWKTTGNSYGNLLGRLDSVDFVFKTHNSEALNVSANGVVLLNESPNLNADFQSKGAVLLEGEHQDFTIDTIINNGFYWEPRKSSLVIGNEMSPFYSGTSKGRYSFAGGKQSLANSWSFAWGDSCIASGNNVVVFGANNIASPLGLHKYGTSVVLGKNNETTLYRSTLVGSHLKVNNIGGSNTVIGTYSQITDGGGLITLGNHLENSGRSHFMIGNYLRSTGNVASPKAYSMMIGDHSTTSYLVNVNNIRYQLLMRFDGGVYFYSDSLVSTGVVLYSGSGSWAMLSDRKSKENLEFYKWIDSNKKGIEKISKWNYTAQDDDIIHLGIMAQDFNSSFILKEDPNRISMIDMDGVTLSGIGFVMEKLDYDEERLIKIDYQLNDIKLKQDLIIELLEKVEEKGKGGTL